MFLEGSKATTTCLSTGLGAARGQQSTQRALLRTLDGATALSSSSGACIYLEVAISLSITMTCIASTSVSSLAFKKRVSDLPEFRF